MKIDFKLSINYLDDIYHCQILFGQLPKNMIDFKKGCI